MNATDFRIGELQPIADDPDAPVRQTIHMSPLAAEKFSQEIRRQLSRAGEGQWVAINIIGFRLIPSAMEALLVRKG